VGNGKIYVGVDQGLLGATLKGAESPSSIWSGCAEHSLGIYADAGEAVWFSSGMHISLLDGE